jgi:protein disulfide-isomerase A1
MKTSTIILFALVATAVFAEDTWGYKEEEDVIVATTDTFDEMINKYDNILVEFYAPWCGHCKKLAPEYSQAAAQLKKSDPPVPLAKVDATIEKVLATRFSIQGLPTFKLFVKGQESEYKGGRTKSEIVDWIMKKTGPPSRLLADQAAVDAAKTDNKVVVVYYGAESDAEYGVYTTVAATTENVVFTHVFNADLAAEAGAKVVLYKQFDEGTNKLEGEVSAATLKDFIDGNRYEIVMPFEGEDPINRIFQQEQSAIILFSDKAGDHETVFATFAKANRGRIIFSQSRTNEGLGQRLAEYIGVKSEDAPCVRLINPSAGDLSKYIYDGAINAEELQAFLGKWEAGTLERTFKSADVPATNDEPVKVIVGKNFDEYVTNSGKDVLLEFYAPWCGHCKTLAPKYDEAAAKLLHMSDKLTIAKMDATENEVPGVAVQGFPTLKFWKAGQATPIDYDGARETDGIIDWLKKNVSFDWVEAPAGETDL